MPYDPSGTFSTVYTFAPNTPILSSEANTNNNDFADGLTQAFLRDGSIAMGGALQAIPGSAATPGYTFTGDTDTGIIRTGPNSLGLVAGGSLRVTINATGSMTGPGVPAAPDAFPSGTGMLFHQSNAPTGWTKSTLYNNRALRVTTGTISGHAGTDFTTVFSASRAVSGTNNPVSLSIAQLPSHAHGPGNLSVASHSHGSGTLAGASHSHGSGTLVAASAGNHAHILTNLYRPGNENNGGGFTGVTYTGTAADDDQEFFSNTTGAHTHSISGSTQTAGVGISGSTTAAAPGVTGGITSENGSGAVHSHGWTGSVNLDVSYIDVIIAIKD